MEKDNFSLYELTEYGNEPLIITYKPVSSSYKYTYEVYKDGKIISSSTVTNRKPVDITLDDSGIYQIIVTSYDRWDHITKYESGMYKLDLSSPHIISDSVINLEQTSSISMDMFKSNIRVEDNIDNDLYDDIKCDFDKYNFSKSGLYKVDCSVSDKAGNTTSTVLNFNVKKSTKVQYQITLSLILLFIFILLILFIRYRKAIALEKKISKYTVEPLKNKEDTLFEKGKILYIKIIDKVSEIFNKSEILNRMSKKYEKYIRISSFKNSMDIISSKFIIGMICMILSIFSKTIQFEVINLPELLISFIIGNFIPNIYYFVKYKMYRNRLENDLLQAIIIMNNAFKSGRSISQAIELVTKELKGPIAEEFKKMSLELSFGLSIDVVFKRFGERVKIDEINYLTSSLSILNKTGGNIIKVFSSIEKTLFNKKKLKLELSSLTGSSKLIVYALFIIPLLFIVFISVISPSYFEPLYTTLLGRVLSILIFIIYIIYVFFVRKIMKVRM